MYCYLESQVLIYMISNNNNYCIYKLVANSSSIINRFSLLLREVNMMEIYITANGQIMGQKFDD